MSAGWLLFERGVGCGELNTLSTCDQSQSNLPEALTLTFFPCSLEALIYPQLRLPTALGFMKRYKSAMVSLIGYLIDNEIFVCAECQSWFANLVSRRYALMNLTPGYRKSFAASANLAFFFVTEPACCNRSHGIDFWPTPKIRGGKRMRTNTA